MYRRRRLTALGAVLLLAVGIGAVVAFAAGGGEERVADPALFAGPPAETSTGGAAGTVAAAAAEAGGGPVEQRTEFPPGEAEFYSAGPGVDKVALTFDDGSCEPCVGDLAELLDRSGVKATIFPNGMYADSWEPHAEAYRELLASGQIDIGNHTFDHENATEQTPKVFKRDLKRNQAWIKKTFGAEPRPIFRPPFGAYDDKVLKAAGELGYTQVVNWSVGALDWETQDPNVVFENVREQLTSGAIILMHANGDWSIEALPRIIELLEEEGLEPVTLRELLDS
jgi:peptidoglycan/xylan/chitin deacetylase (PgdA/CDA1 family)